MELLTEASGEKPQVTYDAFIAAIEKPLFEILKDLPQANVTISIDPESRISTDDATLYVRVTNGDRYARLVRLRTDWNNADNAVSDLVLYDDNYFDLSPGESRVITARLPHTTVNTRHLSRRVQVQGANVPPTHVPIIQPAGSP